MSLIDDIMGKIFSPQGSSRPTPLPPTGAPTSATPPTIAPASPIDAHHLLETMAAQHKEKLNWQTSIVDLLKVLNMDSSLKARQQLAQELGYTGDAKDSAQMNTWLIEAVTQKLRQNGSLNEPPRH